MKAICTLLQLSQNYGTKMCFPLHYKKYDLQRCSHNVMVITKLDTVKSYFDSQTFIFVVPICQNSFDPSFYQLPFYFIFLFAFVQLKIKKCYDIFFLSPLYEKLCM